MSDLYCVGSYLLPHQPIGLALVQFDLTVGLRFSNGPGKNTFLGSFASFCIGNTYAYKRIFINASSRRTSNFLLKIQVLHEKTILSFSAKH